MCRLFDMDIIYHILMLKRNIDIPLNIIHYLACNILSITV